MVRIGMILALAFAALVGVGAPAWAEAGQAEAGRRVALVIGNAGYPGGNRLLNPTADAADMTARLQTLGFRVEHVDEANLEALLGAVERFAEAAGGAEAAVLFYAGHAFQFEDQNWLMPIDTDLQSTIRARRTNVSLQQVLDEVGGRAATTIVFLDACRTNPMAERFAETQRASGRAFGPTRGLRREEVKNSETLIVFATRPNMVAADGEGRNSPFTAALLAALAEPQVEVEAMMKRVTATVERTTGGKQIPERLSGLRHEFYFRAASLAASAGGPPPAANDAVPAGRDAFDRAKAIGSLAAWDAFLSAFPKGVYADLAREERKKLAAPAEIPAPAKGDAGRSVTECDRLAAPPIRALPPGVTGVPFEDIDAPKAILACRAAVEAKPGVPRLMFNLGRALQKSGDWDGAIGLYRRVSEMGYPPGMTALGFMYANGRGVPRDDAEAVRLYRRGAEGGHGRAMVNLGEMYANGRGVARDDTEAVQLFRKAVDIGNPDGALALASMYETGRGVARSAAEAKRWRAKADELRTRRR